MNIDDFAIEKQEAREKWAEYVQACKDNPKDKFLQDMKAVYNQAKQGRKLIDIIRVMKRGGLNMDGLPRLAICQADSKTCFCTYYKSGRVTFKSKNPQWDSTVYKKDVLIEQIFPELPEKHHPQFGNAIVMEAPVPPVPPRLMPKGNLGDYHILWEVEEWKMVPPKDPYLLRRLSGNIFVLLAGWNLTELERSVMAGRLI